MDVLTKQQRHLNMTNIKGHDTKPELYVRKFLFANGFRYRVYDKRYPGKPDIVLPKYKTVIFVNGCFWHKHEGCKYFVWPKTNQKFWKDKIEANVERDHKNYVELEVQGWKVIVVWECEVKTIEKREARLNKLVDEIRK